ncbi:response regulator [Pseudolysobacter antarcticus]|uniref:histidine kinase n=1 Tax=Pseudolysobacter antarcticus TaxID=2511995 RepID=A0A411HJF4_9GAMM|nr:ATP-binding protein [Pseudolysobacter antarcticus]QBB70517.1 response regulator [Pseudolysobacter antarcticus]
MKAFFMEGIRDDSDKSLRVILRTQAKVRLLFAVPVVAINLVLLLLTAGSGSVFHYGLASACCVYAVTPYLTIAPSSTNVLKWLLIATAILDPWVLSFWIVLTGNYGSLIAGFYLFTMVGFGFRTGRRLMHLCQAAALIGFAAVFVFDPLWQRMPIIWLTLAMPMIVVPVYAGRLMTVLREARVSAEEARALAEQETRAKSDLLAKVSHELRTPLTGIVATAELLGNEHASDSRVAHRVETILALSSSLLSEINDLLDQSKFDTKHAVLNPAAFDLTEHMPQLCRTFETMAHQKGLSFRLELDSQIVDPIEIDAHMLDRVCLNLVGNAIKFTDQGSVHVGIDLLHKSDTHYRLVFSIADTGIGIPESFRKNIFQAFEQVDQGKQRRFGGTGLGLALSKRVVELMGGALQYSSTLGQGSRFWFELNVPLADAQSAQPDHEAEAVLISPQRILVADDNETNLMLIKEMLEIDGHVVTTCTSGIGALEYLNKQAFDVLLLDYNLGDMDGVRVLQTYRFGRTHTAPTIFLTADATPQTAARLYEAGSAAILYKPMNLTVIRKALMDLDDSFGKDAETEGNEIGPEMMSTPTRRAVKPTLSVVPVYALDADTLDGLRSMTSRPEFLPALLASAERDIRRSCQLLTESLARKNYVPIRDTAHALKGVCINVGAMRLAAIAASLMTISSDEIERSTERLSADVQDALQITVLALQKAVGLEVSATSTGNTRSLHVD